VQRSPDRRRSPARLLSGIVLWLALGALAPAPASAHAELIQADPTPNATLPEAPTEVTIAFSEAVDPGTAFIDLLDHDQLRVEGVGPVELDADGRLARAALPPLEPGSYTVAYQVVSTVDGHATTGSFVFLVDPTGAAAPPVTPLTTTSPSVDALTIGARWVALAALLLALGSIVGWWRARDLPGGVGPPPWGLIGSAAAAGAIGTWAYLWLAARPIARAIPASSPVAFLDPAAPFGWTPFAVAMRIALVVAFAVAAIALVRRRRTRPIGLAGVLLAIALAGMSAAAHAASYGGPVFATLDWIHLLAVASWLGPLPALFLLARRSSAPRLSVLLHRHGGVALVAAPVVLVTGIANSPLVLGGARDLVGTDYGNLLLAKAALLSVALGIGAVNHVAVRGRGRSATAVLLAVELVVAAVAVSAAATMVTIQPAAARQPILTAPPVNPAHLFGEVGPDRLHLTVNPPTPGTQAIQAWLTQLGTGLPTDDVRDVEIELTPPGDAGADALTVRLEESGEIPGLFGASGAFVTESGDWTVGLQVLRDGAPAERISFELPVSLPAPAEPVPQPDTGIGVPAPLAAVWSILPPGMLAWLPALLALVALAASWRWRRSAIRSSARAVLVGVVVVAGIGAASRTVVDAANAPVAGRLEAPPPSARSGDLDLGEGIYLANCASCHGRDGDGAGPIVTTPSAGSIVDDVRTTSAADLSYRIAYGVAGTPMPAFAGTLTRDERWALVAYLRSRWAEP
jgi:copper transport protein